MYGAGADAPAIPQHTEQHSTVETFSALVSADSNVIDLFTNATRGKEHDLQELKEHGPAMITDFLARYPNMNNDTAALLIQCRHSMDEANKRGSSPIKPAELALKAMSAVIKQKQSGKEAFAQGKDSQLSQKVAIKPKDVDTKNNSFFDQLTDVKLGPTGDKGFKTKDNYFAARKWILDQYPEGNTSHTDAVTFVTSTLSHLKPGVKPSTR